MCDKHFDPLDDTLDDMIGDFGSLPQEQRTAHLETRVEQMKPQYVENCKKCHGSGKFRGYSGRVVGDCHACKGKGVMTFKTAPEQRARARQRIAEDKAARLKAWTDEHADEWFWMMKRGGSFEFAAAMVEAVTKYGNLTEGQLAAVRRCMLRDADREARFAAEREEREKNAAPVAIGRIEDALRGAKANKVRWPKLRLDTFVFSLAGDESRNPGAVYVKDKDTDAYLGKVMDGKLTRSRDCTAEQEVRIVAAASDPEAAAKAYGQRYGACSICGRELTVNESIDRAMGPICAAKYGWD